MAAQMTGHATCWRVISFDTVEDFLMKRLIALFLVTASLAALSACNTMAGAGEDVSAGGHALTNSAEKAK
jgi:predicted small secreted protein